MKVLIIGAGRMGSLLTQKLSMCHLVKIYDKNISKAQEVAEKLNTEVLEPENFKEAEIIILALPGEVVSHAVREMESYFKDGQILVNVATTGKTEDIERAINNKCPVISAKIIGHAKETMSGEPLVFLIDGNDHSAISMVCNLLGKIGKVQRGSEALVQTINTIATREGIKAAYRIQQEFNKLELPEDLLETAIRNVAAGAMKAYASGDAGDFAKSIILQMEEEKSNIEDEK